MPQGDPAGTLSHWPWRKAGRSDILSWRSFRRIRPEPVAVCAYLLLFWLPIQSNISLLILAAFGVFASIHSSRETSIFRVPLRTAVLVFLGTLVISILFSSDISHSLRLSAPFLPGILLFFLISRFESSKQITVLFAVFSSVTLLIGCALFWIAMTSVSTDPRDWIAEFNSPIFVVVNDIMFLVIAAPLSLVLLMLSSGYRIRALASLSLFVTLVVVAVYQSRTATVALVISIMASAIMLQSKFAAWRIAVFVIGAIVMVDGIFGFPLCQKLTNQSGRIAFPLVSWAMFLDEPIHGQGLHTFGLHYQSYLAALDLPSWVRADLRPVPWAHNLYAQVLAEQGLIGISALLFLVASTLRVARKTIRIGDRRARLLAIGLIGALISFLVGALFDSSFLREWVVIELFCIIALISRLSTVNNGSGEDFS